MCGMIAFTHLAVVCLQENAGMFANACVTEAESSKAADIIDDVVEAVELKSA